MPGSDFDGDGFDDLAVGLDEDVGGDEDAGAVNVLAGSAGGLAAAGAQIWHQNSPGVPGVAEPNEEFGWALAVGDFDGDGFDDLAVGVRLENVGGLADAGAVNVLLGSAGGLTAAGSQIWHEDSPGVPGVAESGDQFGYALAAGDFDGDGFDDLALGVRFDGVSATGSVHVLSGSAGGLTAAGSQVWHQDSLGVPGVAEPGDLFGSSLFVGDFDRDGFDDLAIGVPEEDVGGASDAGAVNVLFGSACGLTAAGSEIWHQASVGVPGAAEDFDRFGNVLA